MQTHDEAENCQKGTPPLLLPSKDLQLASARVEVGLLFMFARSLVSRAFARETWPSA